MKSVHLTKQTFAIHFTIHFAGCKNVFVEWYLRGCGLDLKHYVSLSGTYCGSYFARGNVTCVTMAIAVSLDGRPRLDFRHPDKQSDWPDACCSPALYKDPGFCPSEITYVDENLVIAPVMCPWKLISLPAPVHRSTCVQIRPLGCHLLCTGTTGEEIYHPCLLLLPCLAIKSQFFSFCSNVRLSWGV